MESEIRFVSINDAKMILDIYRPYVQDTAISFEITVPTEEEMQNRIDKVMREYPWLVSTSSGLINGYAYASRHRNRAAYQWSVDVSIYVKQNAHEKGIGKELYQALFQVLTIQGYYNAYAGITLPNPASVGLHEKMGFTSIGIYKDVGFKLNAWHDVGWWQLQLSEKNINPQSPKGMKQLLNDSRIMEILKYE